MPVVRRGRARVELDGELKVSLNASEVPVAVHLIHASEVWASPSRLSICKARSAAVLAAGATSLERFVSYIPSSVYESASSLKARP